MKNGWLDKKTIDITQIPCFDLRFVIILYQGTIFYFDYREIPDSMKQKVFQCLHTGHLEISPFKSFFQSY